MIIIPKYPNTCNKAVYLKTCPRYPLRHALVTCLFLTPCILYLQIIVSVSCSCSSPLFIHTHIYKLQANQLQGKRHMISKWPISMLCSLTWSYSFYHSICITLNKCCWLFYNCKWKFKLFVVQHTIFSFCIFYYTIE